MKLRVIGLLIAIIASFTTSPSSSQENAQPWPDAPNRPDFGGGPPRFMPRMESGPVQFASMLGLPEVQQELNLSDEQKVELRKLHTKFEQQLQGLMQGAGPPRFGEDPQKMQQQFEAMRTKSDATATELIDQVKSKLNGEQLARFEQLHLQRAGSAALRWSEVAQRLKLTEAQRTAIQEIEHNSVGPPFMQAQNSDKALATLDAEQKIIWQVMIGREFKFPQGGAFGPPGFGPPGFGPPGIGREDLKLVKSYDANKDGWLNAEERKLAAEKAKQSAKRSGPAMPFGGPPGGGTPGSRGRFGKAPQPGTQVKVEDVTPITDAKLYDPHVLRTLLLQFDSDAWEQELEQFQGTDVEFPCTLTVDGQQYPNVGVSFRGMSSYMGVPAGFKRSLNLSLELANPEQKLYGYKNLNLLNNHGDPSLMSTVLYSQIAQVHMPVPKANFVKVVINGENWGIYTNVQQFDKAFISENFKITKGTRWKVSGSPGGNGGLSYLGDDIEQYKPHYEMKSGDSDKAWQALIELCRVLSETPPEKLEEAIEPLLDLEGTLWFLALDVALVNNDGYWSRASDYSIFLDDSGKFHVIPHDMNEAFPTGHHGPFGPRPMPEGAVPGRGKGPAPLGQRGPGQFRGPMHGGVDLDPLVSLDNPRTPLRSRLLKVPQLRAKYLSYVRAIAEESLDWNNLGPTVEQYRQLIAREVELDTRKLYSFEDFTRATGEDADTKDSEGTQSLKSFAERRRSFLLQATATDK